jgi:hypothetical protein
VKPSISPDQIWAMRRFLPAVLPGLVLLAFGALSGIVRAPRPGGTVARKVVAVALGVGAIAYPVWTDIGLRNMTEQRGEYAAVREVCTLLGARSAAIILEDRESFLDRNTPQTLRSFCNVPTAVMPGAPNGSALRTLAEAWRRDGRPLYVVARSPEMIRRTLGLAARATPETTNHHLLNARLLWRPDHYTSESLQFAVAPVLPS